MDRQLAKGFQRSAHRFGIGVVGVVANDRAAKPLNRHPHRRAFGIRKARTDALIGNAQPSRHRHRRQCVDGVVPSGQRKAEARAMVHLKPPAFTVQLARTAVGQTQLRIIGFAKQRALATLAEQRPKQRRISVGDYRAARTQAINDRSVLPRDMLKRMQPLEMLPADHRDDRDIRLNNRGQMGNFAKCIGAHFDDQVIVVC